MKHPNIHLVTSRCTLPTFIPSNYYNQQPPCQHLNYRIQCIYTLPLQYIIYAPCQPSPHPTITIITTISTNNHHVNISITGSSASLEEPSDACHSLVPWLCKTTTSQVPKNISTTISDNYTPQLPIKVPPQVLSERYSHRLRLSPRSNWRATHFTATAGKNNIIYNIFLK